MDRKRAALVLSILMMICFGGCVRVAGTAGYWKTGENGTVSKQAGFDTHRLVQKDQAPGSVTF